MRRVLLALTEMVGIVTPTLAGGVSLFILAPVNSMDRLVTVVTAPITTSIPPVKVVNWAFTLMVFITSMIVPVTPD